VQPPHAQRELRYVEHHGRALAAHAQGVEGFLVTLLEARGPGLERLLGFGGCDPARERVAQRVTRRALILSPAR